MKCERLNPGIVAIAALVIGLIATDATAQCFVSVVERPDEVRRGRSLSIRLFEIKAPPNYTGEPVENLRIALAEKMWDSLLESKYFSSVVILPEDKQPETDLVLEGEFTNIEEGNRAARILTGGGMAETGISGKLMATNPSGKVFDFVCARATAGGVLGMGGYFAGSGKGLINSNIEKFAGSLKKVIQEVEKEMAEVKARKRSPIVADQHHPDQDWRNKPPDQWSQKDCLKVFSTFSVGSKFKKDGAASASWYSSPYYQSLARTRELRQAGKLQNPDYLFLPSGLLPKIWLPGELSEDLEYLKGLEKEEMYLFEIWYTKLRRPVYYNRSNTAASTFLRRAGKSAERILPVALNSLPDSFRSAFAFPTRLSDGTPIIENLNDKLELHTEIDGRSIIIHFDLKKFGLSRLEDLKLKPTAQTTEPTASSSRPRAVSEKPKSDKEGKPK
jgi:hypothetical protein